MQKRSRPAAKSQTKKPAKRQLRKFTDEAAVNSLSNSSLEKRWQIAEAALDCFVESGYVGASMNAVAARAGVTKQTIYSHYKDKETLFKQVFQSRTIDLVRVSADGFEHGNLPAKEALLNIGRTIMQQFAEPRYLNFFRMVIGEAGRFPELSIMLNETTIGPGLELVATILRKQKEYKILDPEAFSRVFMGSVVHYCLQQHVLRGKEVKPFEAERVLAELARTLECHKI